jgi:Galactose mutarotase and related enzymes
MTRQRFGLLPGGGGVEVHAFTNTNGVEVRAMSYGATVISIRTPDLQTQFDDIVLGFDAFDDYLTKARYFGSIVGRYGNRIAGGRFTLTAPPSSSLSTTVRTTCMAARTDSTARSGGASRSTANPAAA